MKNYVRKCLLKVFIGVCMLWLSGCTTGNSVTPEENPEKIMLKVCVSNINVSKEVLEELSGQYIMEHPEIESIRWEVVSDDAYYNLLRMNLASGNLPDIIMVNGTNELEEWIGHLLPLDETEAISRINKKLLEGSKWKSVYYSLPIMCEEVGIIYNMSLLQSVGWEEIPRTYSELEALCADLEEQQIKVFINSYTNTARMIESGLMQMISMKEFPELYMTVLEQNNQSDIAHDEDWNQLMNFYDLTLAYGNRRPLEISKELARNYFNIEKYAMIVNESMGSFRQINLTEEKQKNIQIGPLLLSDDTWKNKLQVRVIRLGVTKYCSAPEAARDFLEWLASENENNEFSKSHIEKISRCTEDDMTTIRIKRTIPDVMVEKMMPIWAQYISGEITRDIFWNEISASLQDYAEKYKRR